MRSEIKRRWEIIRRGEIPDGYRRTKIGVAPLEWEIVPLKSMFSPLRRKNEERNANVLTISAQYGLIAQEDFFSKSVASEDTENYFLLERGDFAYNKSRAKGYPFGALKPLTRYEKGVVSPLYLCFSPTGANLCPEYYAQYFDAGLMNREIQAFAQEGARNHGLLNVSSRDFFHASVLCPPLTEQRAIAEILSAQDNAIRLKERLIEEKRRQKKWLMQQFLTGKRRLSGYDGDWTTEKLENLCSLNPKSASANPAEVTFLGMTDVSESGQIINQRVIPYSAVKNGYTPFMRGDVLLAKITPCFENGKGAYTDNLSTKFGFGSTEFHVLRRNSKILGKYLFFHTQSYRFRKKLESEMTGTAGQKRVPISAVALYTILCPPIAEQRAIADILSTADREIQLLERELSEERRQKKALSQLLLTGIARPAHNPAALRKTLP